MANKRDPEKKMFGVYLTPKQRKVVKALAELDGIPMTSVVKQLIMEEGRRKGITVK